MVDQEKKLPTPKQGEIWWVQLENDPKSKPRPVVVISEDIRNRRANDILAIPLTSTLKSLPMHVLIREDAGGLPHDSMAKCEQITVILREDLLSRLGDPLPRNIIKKLIVGIVYSLADPVHVEFATTTTVIF